MKSLKLILPGMLALVLAAVPALAQKELVVDYETARVYPLQDGRLARSPIRANNRKEFAWKDIGTFRISEKIADKRSNLYNIDGDPIQPGDDGARMRYWMRLGGTAQGFHLSALFRSEGSPHQSHGCYRLSRKSATWLFDWAPVGTAVHVVRSLAESRFAEIARPHSSAVLAARTPSRAKAAISPGTAKTLAAVKPAPRSEARPAVAIRPAPSTSAARPAPRAKVSIRPAPRPEVVVRPAPPRVTVTRLAEKRG